MAIVEPNSLSPEPAAPVSGSALLWPRAWLIIMALFWTYHSLSIQVDYSDTFETLMNVKHLWGWETYYSAIRPTLGGFYFLPGILLDEYLPLAGNHLGWIKLSTTLCVVAWLWLFWRTMQPWFGSFYAAVALILLSLNRLVLHYTPFGMQDLLATALLTMSLFAYYQVRQQGRSMGYYRVALWLALATMTKYILWFYGLLAILLYEALLWLTVQPDFQACWRQRRWWSIPVAGVLLPGVGMALIYTRVYGVAEMPKLFWHTFSHHLGTAGIGNSQYASESLWEYFWTLWYSMSPLIMALLLLGVGLALWRPRPERLLLVAWFLAVVLIATVVQHKESRYLLPALPAAYGLVVLALSEGGAIWREHMQTLSVSLQRGFAVTLAVLMVISIMGSAIREIGLLSSPAFRTPVMQTTGLRLREPIFKKVYWLGQNYPIYAADPPLHAGDEFYNVFHLSPLSLSYFSHRRDLQWKTDPQAVAIDKPDVVFTMPDYSLKRFEIKGSQSRLSMWSPPDWVEK